MGRGSKSLSGFGSEFEFEFEGGIEIQQDFMSRCHTER